MNQEELLKAQYNLLAHAGLGYTEFRVLQLGAGNSEKIERAFAQNENEFVKEAIRLIAKYPDRNIFVGLNPRIDPKAPSAVGNIGYLCVLMVDCDPIRPKGEGSTDESHDKALGLGKRISSDIPNSILVDSGSGAHVYLPLTSISVTNAKALTASCKEWSDEIIEKYQTEGLKFDSVYDLPRVTRLWSSFNPKSNRTVTPLTNTTSTFSRITLSFNQFEDTNKFVSPALSSVSERFHQLLKLHPGLKSTLDGKADFKSPSERNYCFVSYLVRAHFTADDIKTLAREYYPKQGSDKRDEAIDSDVDRIIEKINKENKTSNVSLVHSSDRYEQNLAQRKMGLSTGLSSLDNMLAGLQNGKLYVLAARTNEGKTSLACSVAYNLIMQNYPVLYFPTELGYEPLFDKLVAQSLAKWNEKHKNFDGINLKKFLTGEFTQDEKELIHVKMRELSQLPFIVHQDFGLTSETVTTIAKEICPKVIIIDFIQAMKYTDEDNKAHQIENNIRAFKELNEHLNIPIILTSQFNRGAINNELNLSQLKGSGAIEEYADVVMAISTRSKTEYPRPVDLHILKSRYGEVGKVRLDFFSSIGIFKEHTED